MESHPQYMIHACLKREWYVRDYLIPDMIEQGIPEEDIEVWLDSERRGNLTSCLESFEAAGQRGSGRWHLQDDVLISKDFSAKTAEFNEGIVCGYVHEEWQDLGVRSGRVPAVFMWNSFPCIRIPDDYARDFVTWVRTDAAYRDTYRGQISHNRGDDTLFMGWICEMHLDDFVTNISPNIVEHIDFLIGGSVTNVERGQESLATLWDDQESFNRMRDKLALR